MSGRLLIAILMTIGLTGCSGSAEIPSADQAPTISQISLINGLMLGRYEGIVSIRELLAHGDFGLGTMDHLDGELIVLDGHAYQVDGEGNVRNVADERSTPFATVLPFRGIKTWECPPSRSLSELDARLNAEVPSKNYFVAVRIDARIDSLTLRSVKRQEPPYRPLSEVAKEQSVWTHKNLSGTLLGIRSPIWAGGLNVPGTHWHFLSDDRSIGGHVLDCAFEKAVSRYDICREWRIVLDPSDEFGRLDLGKDLSDALLEVESARGPQEK
jgi:acetolactate decarboxylase